MDLFDWIFGSSEQKLDYKTFDVNLYEKRLKPTGGYARIAKTEPGYVPQLKINGIWKTLCVKRHYRGRSGSRLLYFFLMPENNTWCEELLNFGKDNRFSEEKETAPYYFEWYDKAKKNKIEQLEKEGRLSELESIYL